MDSKPKQKKDSNLLGLILIAVIVTAGVVGSAVYYLAPRGADSQEITSNDVENYLMNAEDSDIKYLVEQVQQDILAETLKIPRQVTMGFIWSFPHDGSGWCAGSEDSMNWMLERYPNIRGYRTEDIGPEDTNSIVASMIEKQDCELIFVNDEFIGLPVFEINNQYPNTLFHMMISGDTRTDTNFIRSGGKIYQAAYLCGLIAGELTETNAIASTWSYPIAFLTQIVNAFALGVQEVNPDARVYGGYADSWYDPPTESEVTTSLIDTYDCDVVFSLTDSPVPAQVANEKGAWAFVPYGDQVQMGWVTDTDIVSSYIYQRHVQWDQIYKDYLAGIERPRNFYYLGYDKPLITDEGPIYPIDLALGGKVGLDGISDEAKAALSDESLQHIKMRRDQMIAGTFDPFRYYRIVDTEGNVRYEAGEYPPLEKLLTEVYFIEGVIPPG